MRPTILTSEGHYFDFTNPEESVFTIKTIAHALSHICRFGGHTQRHYSVAQHSVLVSCIVPPRLALHGLLHDAAEAFLGDVPSPLKALLPDYKALERIVEPVVLGRFGLHGGMPRAVKSADRVALCTEQRDLMLRFPDEPTGEFAQLDGVQPLPQRVRAWPIWYARLRFRLRYWQLTRRL